MTPWEPTGWPFTRPDGSEDADGEFNSLWAMHPLEWFIRLRWAFIGACVAVLAIERLALPSIGRPRAVYGAVIALLAANILWWFVAIVLRRRASRDSVFSPDSSRSKLLFANAQIAVDLLVLTVFVRYTGGIESPLAIFYVFHMALGPLLLPAGYALAQGLWAMALYAAVALGELTGALAPHYSLLPTLERESLYLRPMYVIVALAAVACCVVGTIYLTATVATRLRTREKSLWASNAALRQSQTAIRDLQARRSRFMQTAAHRLKSPLATVQTLAGLIRDEVVRGADAGATYERIARCCDEGITHVAELLTLARVQDADPQRHRDSHVHVGIVATDVCAQFKAAASNHGVTLNCAYPPHVDLFAGVDPRDMADCIGNVVDNAVKFTPSSGRVSVSVEREEPAESSSSIPQIVVHVDDTGIGFDADSLAGADVGGASVFDAYRRGNNALAAGIPGSGLGLAIVCAIVEQAGGRITVQSTPGRGTQFTLRFPAAGAANGGPAVHDTRVTTTQSDRPVNATAPTGANAPVRKSGRRPGSIENGEPMSPASGARSDRNREIPSQPVKETDHALC